MSGCGFVGAGEITAAIVEGLCTNTDEPPAIFLSPRGRDVGRELAGRFSNVRVCDSNQAVLDSVTSIVLAVRPPIARTVLGELSFRPHHVMISAVAGVRLEQLRAWASPAGRIVRAIPLPHAVQRQSMTAMYPDNSAARDLFDRVGSTIVPDDEKALDAFSAVTATFAAHIDYLTTIANWLTGQGVDDDVATAYIASIFGQLGRSLTPHSDLGALTKKYMTPGGLNEQFLADLRRDNVPDTVRRGLDRILARVSG